MATETIRPNGNSQTELYNSGATQSNNYSYVDESSANDSDYVVNLVSYDLWGTDLYALPDTAIPAGSTINSITFYGRFKNGTGTASNLKFSYKSGGTTYYSDAVSLSTSYTQKSWEQTTNQKTSAAWTIDNINDLLAGVSLYSVKNPGNPSYCSQFWLVIDYTEGKKAKIIIF